MTHEGETDSDFKVKLTRILKRNRLVSFTVVTLISIVAIYVLNLPQSKLERNIFKKTPACDSIYVKNEGLREIYILTL